MLRKPKSPPPEPEDDLGQVPRKRLPLANQKRLRQIETLWVEKGWTVPKIAEHLGVRPSIVHRYVQYLTDVEWRSIHHKSNRRQALLRVRQLEAVYATAMTAFEKSKNGGFEEIQEVVKIDCVFCKGTGILNEDYCSKCGGEGKHEKISVRYERKTLPGEPAHLQVAMKALEGIRKLRGLDRPTTRTIKTESHSTHLSASLMANNPLRDASPEMIHDIMARVHEEQQALRQQRLLEGKVIDPQ